jgi:F-type H+-transporting ATPase subunit b
MAESGTSAHTEVPGGGHKTFPPFEKETFPSQIFWFALTFIALYLLMSRIALPRIGGIIAEREGKVSGDLTEAQRLKGESDEAIAAYEKSLTEARGRAQSLANEAREREAAAAEAKRKELDGTLHARIAQAEKGIAERRTAAMSSVETIAIDAAAAIVERLAGRAPPSAAVAQAIAGVLKR